MINDELMFDDWEEDAEEEKSGEEDVEGLSSEGDDEDEEGDEE